jgi:uncharacterized protein (TIGR02145 family)
MKKTLACILLLLSLMVTYQRCSRDDEEAADRIILEADIRHVSDYGGNDGAIDLTVSGGTPPYIFLWSNGETSEDIDSLTAGRYGITISDISQLMTVDTFTVMQPDSDPLVVVITGTDVSVYGGSDGSARAMVSGGLKPYGYVWSNGSTLDVASDLTAGTYYLTVTDAETRMAIDSIHITQPGPNDIIIQLSVTDPSETGACDGTIETDLSGGYPPYSCIWSNGSTEQDLHNLGAGEYTISVTDLHDQIATRTVVLTDSLQDIDENRYGIVKIGDQTWMKQNLTVEHSPEGNSLVSYTYDNDPGNAGIYGRLYTWDVAMNGTTTEGSQGICPCGWHIPSDEEFKILEMYLGMTREEADMVNTWRGADAGTQLKAGGTSGYEALLCGRRSSSGYYSLLNSFEYVWTSTEYGEYAWRRCLDINSAEVGRWNTFPKNYGFSVRCIKDENQNNRK